MLDREQAVNNLNYSSFLPASPIKNFISENSIFKSCKKIVKLEDVAGYLIHRDLLETSKETFSFLADPNRPSLLSEENFDEEIQARDYSLRINSSKLIDYNFLRQATRNALTKNINFKSTIPIISVSGLAYLLHKCQPIVSFDNKLYTTMFSVGAYTAMLSVFCSVACFCQEQPHIKAKSFYCKAIKELANYDKRQVEYVVNKNKDIFKKDSTFANVDLAKIFITLHEELELTSNQNFKLLEAFYVAVLIAWVLIDIANNDQNHMLENKLLCTRLIICAFFNVLNTDRKCGIIYNSRNTEHSVAQYEISKIAKNISSTRIDSSSVLDRDSLLDRLVSLKDGIYVFSAKTSPFKGRGICRINNTTSVPKYTYYQPLLETEFSTSSPLSFLQLLTYKGYTQECDFYCLHVT